MKYIMTDKFCVPLREMSSFQLICIFISQTIGRVSDKISFWIIVNKTFRADTVLICIWRI